MNMGCWNVQAIGNKYLEVFRELRSMQIDIAVLSETKKKGNGNEIVDDYLHFYSGVSKSKRAKAGVSIAISKELKSHIKNWTAIDERLITVELVLKGNILVIVGAYAPTNDADDVVKEDFYEKLTQVLQGISRRKEIFLMGDLNGRVGKSESDNVVGQYGEETLNDNGSRIIELCQQFSLKILNGFFQHKEIHKFTWFQPTKQLRSIIDYVIIKQQSHVRVIDVRVQRGADCGSDHFLVKAKLRVKYRNSGGQGKSHKEEKGQKNVSDAYPKYNTKGFFSESTKFLYKLRMASKLKAVPEGGTEQQYESLRQCLHESAFEALGTVAPRGKTKKPYWFNDEVEDMIREKRILYHQWLSTKDAEDRRIYMRYNYMVKKEIKKVKNAFWDKKCGEVNRFLGSSRSREAWKFLGSLQRDTKQQWTVDPIGLGEWKRYYQSLLTESRPLYEKINYDRLGTVQHDQVDEVTPEEVKRALEAMKNNKSSGPGGVPVELLKNAPSIVLECLAKLFNRCLHGGEVPSEWKISHITSIHKKGDKRKCDNYRGISVLSSMGRLYGRVLARRIDEITKDTEEQSGFRAGRSTIDNIFCVKQLMEKTIAYNNELHMVFVDLKKAFDSVPLNKLWVALQENEVTNIYINAIKSLYQGAKSQIKSGCSYSDCFDITKGVRQGCPLSPVLFKIYMASVLRTWTRKCSTMGVQLTDRAIHTLLFADDQIILAEDAEDISYMTRKLIDEFDNWGLEMNPQKTQYMVVGAKGKDLETEKGTIKCTSEYNYLGMLLTSDGADQKDILNKIGKGRALTGKLHSIIWSSDISLKTKQQIFQSFIESSITYGSEVWCVNSSTAGRIRAAEMNFWRRCCQHTLLDHIRNEDIREMTGAQISLTDTIERKQLLWYGHLQRMDQERIPAKVWSWVPQRRRKRGRPRRQWHKGIQVAMRRRGIQEEDCQDRDRWRLNCGRWP